MACSWAPRSLSFSRPATKSEGWQAPTLQAERPALQFHETIQTFRGGKDFSKASDKGTQKPKRWSPQRLLLLAQEQPEQSPGSERAAHARRPSPELLSLRPPGASAGPATVPRAPRAPPRARPLSTAPTFGCCSRSPATRAPLRPGLAQALGPGGPGAATSRGPASPCLAVRLRGSCGQLCDTSGALSRVPGRGAGRSPEEAGAPLVAAGWRATRLRPVRCGHGSSGKASAVPAGCTPLCSALVPGLVSMVTGSTTWSSKVVSSLRF